MGARQSFPSEVEPRQRSSSSSEESTERNRRLQNVRNGENFSTDSEEFDGNEFASSSTADPSLRFSFRPSSSSRISFLQAITTSMNHGSNIAHASHSDANRDRRSLPALRFLVSGRDVKCPVCHKRIPSDDAEVHLVMCFTRPKIAYNEDILTDEKGECAICLEEMIVGHTIARLPCLCIYHKKCIDEWFCRKNCCPEHPGDD